MTGHDDDRALDALDAALHSPPGETSADPALRAEADAIAEALSALAVAAAPATPAAPPPALRARLLASARGPARFAPFIDRLARLIDLAAEQARALLASIDRPDAWLPSPAPNVRLIHLPGGPAVAGLDIGFVRVAAGTDFPPHRHLGDERVLVLQGSYRDSGGATVRAGDQVHMPAGSEHHFSADPERDLIYAVVFGGIEIGGVPVELHPRDP